MKAKLFLAAIGVLMMTSCATVRTDEGQRFMDAVSRDIKFDVQLQETSGDAYYFEGFDTAVMPDYIITASDNLTVARTTFDDPTPALAEGEIWRNLYFNTRQHRIVCVDRTTVNGRRVGFVYTMQSESKKWPTKGGWHWDVTDRRNMQSAAKSLDAFTEQTRRAVATLRNRDNVKNQ